MNVRGVSERSNEAVLKTVDLYGSGGSNPSSSAKCKIWSASSTGQSIALLRRGFQVRLLSGSQLKIMEDIHQQIHDEFINSEEYEKFLYELNQYGLI